MHIFHVYAFQANSPYRHHPGNPYGRGRAQETKKSKKKVCRWWIQVPTMEQRCHWLMLCSRHLNSYLHPPLIKLRFFQGTCRLRAPSSKFCGRQLFTVKITDISAGSDCIARYGSLQGLRATKLSNLLKKKRNCWRESPCVVCLHFFHHECSLSLKSLVGCLH